MKLSSRKDYILLGKKAGIETKDELLNFIKSIGKKISSEDEIKSNTIIGVYIDHRVFYFVKFSKGKAAYKRFKKQLTESLEEDKKVHPKKDRMRGQIFIVTDPSKLKNSWLVVFNP